MRSDASGARQAFGWRVSSTTDPMGGPFVLHERMAAATAVAMACGRRRRRPLLSRLIGALALLVVDA